jgi:kynurenine formamidase
MEMVFKPGPRKDEVGNLKDQNNEQVVMAAKMVKNGNIYSLAQERFRGMPLSSAHPPFEVISYRSPRGLRNEGDFLSAEKNPANVGFNSEVIFGTMHTGTHIDSLGHFTCGCDDHTFNGIKMEEHWGDHGLLKADGSSFLPFFTRGVLLDVAGYKGKECLPKGYGISVEDLQNTAEWEGVQIQKGDSVLIRTGYDKLYPNTTRMAEHKGAGINKEAARWLADKQVVLIGSDTEALEQIPSNNPENPYPVHSLLLIEEGIYIMELLNMGELAEDKKYEFLFICCPLKVRGTTGSMADPIAVV